MGMFYKKIDLSNFESSFANGHIFLENWFE